ncbi:MAG: bifunctional serine/threonine-protein kinase/formylglycine-generating enzyme family protein [Rudaea sp.]
MAEVTHAEPFDVPGYRIVRRLGRGGMADVYLAIQLSLGRPVAIKVLAAERTPNDELITRFEQEARTIARLDHPHIVGIFDVGRTSTGQLYYTMPYVPNGDLGGRDLKANQAAIISMARAMCQALAYAHEQGIVHRDVKPENVLYDKLDRPLLADFGIALTTVGQTRVTREGDTLGSISYMSPEQARGQALDGRSDIYSLGVVCYECLTGTLPFDGPDSLAIALAHVEQPIPRLPPAQRHWQGLIDKAMAKSPDDRFQTATEMLDVLNVFERRASHVNPIAAVATTLAAMPEQIERKLHDPLRARPIGAMVIVLLGVGALGAWMAYRYHASPPAHDNALHVAAKPGVQAAAADSGDTNKTPKGAAKTAHTDTAPPAAGQNLEAEDAGPVAAAADAGTASLARVDAALTIHPPDDVNAAVMPPPATVRMAATSEASDSRFVVVPAQTHYGGKTYRVAHAYALGRYEVTRGEYARFVAATGRASAPCRKPLRPWSRLEKLDWRDPGFAQSDHHPVVCVSWNDANAYAIWLSQKTHQHYRLPRDVEWLHAARLRAAGGDVCSRGDVADQSLGSFLNLPGRFSCSDGFAQTAPVGRFAANALGIHDLLGNVSEWTRSCLPGNAWTRMTDDAQCPERVFRGMSWADGPDNHNFSFSGRAKPDIGYTTVGFRVLREIDDQENNLSASHTASK